MKITKQARRDAKALFLSCRNDGISDDRKVREVVQKVIAAKPRGYMAVLHHFQRLVKLDVERRTARVESATPLSSAQQTEIGNSLAQRYGQGLQISFGHNPALIGGLRIKVGSNVIDGTVQGRLHALEDKF
jgi:F-type H+-transporting ATPase subunit delta